MLAVVSSEGVPYRSSVYSVVIQRSGDTAKVDVYYISGERLDPALMAQALREAASLSEGRASVSLGRG
jgi:hypothetical protein